MWAIRREEGLTNLAKKKYLLALSAFLQYSALWSRLTTRLMPFVINERIQTRREPNTPRSTQVPARIHSLWGESGRFGGAMRSG